MKAIVIDRFGGPDELMMRDVRVPSIEDDEVLIKVEFAGIGQWDIFEREGGYCLWQNKNTANGKLRIQQ